MGAVVVCSSAPADTYGDGILCTACSGGKCAAAVPVAVIKFAVSGVTYAAANTPAFKAVAATAIASAAGVTVSEVTDVTVTQTRRRLQQGHVLTFMARYTFGRDVLAPL
jgi:hypothetical protein